MYPKPLFTIFGSGVYLYGICMSLGIIGCFAFLAFTMWYKKFNETSSDSILFIGVFGTGFGIFSSTVFQAFYNYIANPKEGFHLGSMTFIGGLIGGVVSFLGVWNLYIYVIRPRTKVKWLAAPMNATLTDALPFIPIGITIAHGFGRLGCFFAGCCYGKPADWGLYCAKWYSTVTNTIYMGEKVIPTQLFEMLFLFLLSGVMALLYFKFKFNYNFTVYTIAYGIWRFLIEFWRGDERGELTGGISPSQFWSIGMVLIGIGFYYAQKYYFSKLMKHPELQKKEEKEPEAVAEEAV